MAPLASISFGIALALFLDTPEGKRRCSEPLGEAMLPLSTASLLLASKLLFEPDGSSEDELLTPPNGSVPKRRRIDVADRRGSTKMHASDNHAIKGQRPNQALAPGDPVLICARPIPPEIPRKRATPIKPSGRVASLLRSRRIEGEDWDAGDRFGCKCRTQEYRGFVVQCEECSVWQHGSCFGFRSPSDAPSAYFCEVCRPEYHTSDGKFSRESQPPIRPEHWDARGLINAAWITPRFPHFRREFRFTVPLPSSSETYEASDPVKPFNFAPLEELMRVVEMWGLATGRPFDDCAEALKSSLQKYDIASFTRALEEFRAQAARHKVHWRRARGCSSEVACELMVQAYSRTVSPNAFDLVASRNGNATYGELLPIFASQFMHEAGLGRKRRREVFVDLGSGVGSIALQAALEYGAEGWGCEMMSNPARLAQKQLCEVQARAKAWNLDMGPVHLLEGDFFRTGPVIRALARADVVLATNLLFEDSLNLRMRDMFAKVLPNGCRIVTLRPFVRINRRGKPVQNAHAHGVETLFTTERRIYPPSSVSWCCQAGPWYLTEFHREDRLDEESLNLLLNDMPW